MSKTPFLSWYKNKESYTSQEISIDDYIVFVRTGTNQDDVLKARLAKQQGNKELYEEIKQNTTLVMGSCTIEQGKAKSSKNVSSLNGLIVVDLDKEQVTDELKNRLQNDQYTYVMHQSIGGGKNYCIFVRIDSNRFLDSFHNLSDYYFTNYGLKIDQACKNVNRFRFLSYDSDIFVNEKSLKWKASKPKEKEIKKELTNYIFFENDFDLLLEQIRDRGINICSNYNKWVNVGMALASHFGSSGADKFDFISSFDSKYNSETNSEHYKGFVKSIADGEPKISIGTFYFYCKEAGLEIYSDKTKSIINAVTISKSGGNPTIASVTSNVEKLGFEVEESDNEIIQLLIDSKVDYSKLANEDLKEIEILENFILQRFEPYYNSINKEVYINEDEILDNNAFSDVWLICKKNLDLKKDLTEKNVEHILNSRSIPTRNIISEFFDKHYSEEHETGFIKAYADCINPKSEYNEWALKHWLVGTIFNWTRERYIRKASPLTLVLTGGEQGIGKSTFIKGVLPNELYDYVVEAKIDINKNDSIYRMATSLIMLDEEFGGKSVKNDEEFKAVADTDNITLRRAYGKRDVNVLRICGLAGSSNPTDILKDVSGNRRILPINTESVDFEAMEKVDKVKMLCEAYGILLKDRKSWEIFGEKKKYLEKHTEQNIEVMPFEEIFLSDFRFDPGFGFNYEIIVSQGDIKRYYSDSIRPSNAEVKKVFLKNKKEPKSVSIGGIRKTGYKVWVNSSNRLAEIWHQSNQGF